MAHKNEHLQARRLTGRPLLRMLAWPIMPLMSTQAIAVSAALIAFAAAGCRSREPALPSVLDPDAGADVLRPEFVEVPFAELYAQLFPRQRLPDLERAIVWHRYQGKWVRWTGMLVSVTASGATFRVLPHTVTFDVSLLLDEGGRVRVRDYRPGEPVTFVGRL